MANVLNNLYGRGRKKPPSGQHTVVDWSDSILRAFMYGFVLNTGTAGKDLNTYSSWQALLTGSPTVVPTPNGTGIQFLKASFANYLTGSFVPSAFTWMMILKSPDAGDTATNSFPLQFGTTNDAMGFAWQDTSAGYNSGPYMQTSSPTGYISARPPGNVSYSANTWYTIFGIWDGSSFFQYANGVSGAVTSAPNMLSPVGNAQFGSFSAGAGWNGIIECFLIWSRALNAYELWKLTAEPYHYLVAPPPKILFTSGVSPVLLSGASSGKATLTGALTLLRTAVSGKTTVAASLTAADRLVGASGGKATPNATLLIAKRILGATAGHTTTAATLRVLTSLKGSISGAAAVTGTLSVTRHCGGSVAGKATVTGVIAGVVSFTGAATGRATVIGTLPSAKYLSGGIQGKSTVAGTIRTPKGLVPRPINGTTTVAPVLSVVKRQLKGTAAGSAVANLGFLTLKRSLRAIPSGKATVQATVANQTRRLSGHIGYVAPGHGGGTFQAKSFSPKTFSQRTFGKVTAAVGFETTIITGRLTQTRKLLTQPGGRAVVVGHLFTPTRALVGTVSGKASVTAHPQVTARILVGTARGQTIVNAQIHGKTPLVGHSAGQATVNGKIIASDRPKAVVAGKATVSGHLAAITRILIGTAGGKVTIAGTVKAKKQCAGSTQGKATVHGGIAASDRLKVTIAGRSQIAASLRAVDLLRGHSQGTAQVVGTLTAWPVTFRTQKLVNTYTPKKALQGTYATGATAGVMDRLDFSDPADSGYLVLI